MTRTLMLALVCASAASVGLVQAGRAQDRPGAPLVSGGRAFSNPNFNPAQMGGLMSATDPTRNMEGMLLRRNDVRREIGLDSRQREALEALEQKGRTELGAQMRDQFRELRSLSREERTARMQQQREQALSLRESFQNGLDRRAGEILRPAQRKRLHELDLQWRGGLALADPEMSKQMNLTPEQRARVDELLQQYREQQTKMRDESFGMFRTRFNRRDRTTGDLPSAQVVPGDEAPGTPPGAPAQPMTPEQIQARMTALQLNLEKQRKTLGDKALTVLTADQKASWAGANGKRFVFGRD